uniref:C2H2-type domain-containing protein n=1 Tax=Caenorhabditis tropicalis TaxID=1561998 RepID=A0A1I7UM04_9PELO
MSIPGTSENRKNEKDDDIFNLYAQMSDDLLAKHIEVIMAEVTNRQSTTDSAPSVSTGITNETDASTMRDPKIEYSDEQYLVVHEKASGIQYHPETKSYTWNPRLNDIDGPRRVNELNNYGRDRLHLLNDDPMEERIEMNPADPGPAKPTLKRSHSSRDGFESTLSAKYWNKKGGTPEVPCECSICGAKFKTLRSLLDHRHHTHSEKDMLTCGICRKVFQKRTHIYLHLSQEYKVYHCHGCDNSFASQWHLDKHRCDLPRHDQFSIERAKRRAIEEKEVKEEMEYPKVKENIGETVLVCEFCGKRYSQIHWLQKHREKCEKQSKEVKPVNEVKEEVKLEFQCTFCFRHYNSQYWFDRHREKCNSSTPLPAVVLPGKPTVRCPNCSKMFQTEYTLGYHLRHCKNATIQQDVPLLMNDTVNEERVETEEAPMLEEEETNEIEEEENTEDDDEEDHNAVLVKTQCSVCSLQCLGVAELLTHRKKVHGQLAMLTCGICHKQCNSISSIRRHVSQEYEVYRCHICGRNCYDRSVLLSHECFKPFKIRDPHLSQIQHGNVLTCPACFRSFSTPTSLYNHQMTCPNQQQLQRTVSMVLPDEKQASTSSTPTFVVTRRSRAQSVVPLNGMADSTLQCSECGCQCVSLSELALHLQQIHGREQFSCNFCTRFFPTYRALYDHHMTEVKKWKCNNCHRVFPRKYQLNFHERYCNTLQNN